MQFLYLIFYACLRLQFLDVETNPGLQCPDPAVYRLLCSNAQGLPRTRNLKWPNRGIVSVWHTVVLWKIGLRYVSHVGVAGSRIWSCCAGAGCLRLEGWQQTYEMNMEHFTNPSSSVVVAKCWFLGFVVWERTYVFSLYHNPDIDNQIDYCLQMSMAAMQAEDVHASFLLWVIWMAIIRSGCILQPQIIMVLQRLTSKLSLVTISWCRPSPCTYCNT